MAKRLTVEELKTILALIEELDEIREWAHTEDQWYATPCKQVLSRIREQIATLEKERSDGR